MNPKWYLSTLLIVIAFLGINLEPASQPNQEIILEFNDGRVSLEEAQRTIAIVKQQLQGIGVDNILVQKASNGNLKISYYSTIDVAVVQQILYNKEPLILGPQPLSGGEDPSKLPLSPNSNPYQLNVFEIETGIEVNLDYNGYLLVNTLGNEAYFNPSPYRTFNEIAIQQQNKIEKVAYSLYGSSALEIDNSSRSIPEVRAGPTKGRNFIL